MPVVIIFALMLLVTLMRVFLPKGEKVRGKTKLEVKLSFVERLMYQRVNLYSLGVVLALMTVTGTIANGFQLLVIAVTEAILMIPVTVRLTTEGIAVNNVTFREWKDFTGYSTTSRQISLIAADGSRPLNIPALDERQEELVNAIGHHLPHVRAGKEVRSKDKVTVG